MLRLLRKSRRVRRALRIFFATDIHGSDRCFRKFLAAPRVYEADVLVLGGDITGKGIVPIVDLGSGRYRYRFQSEERLILENGLDEARRTINFNGLYPWIAEEAEVDEVGHDPVARARVFQELILGQMKAWCRLAAERLGDETRCIVTAGNDDLYAVDPVVDAAPRVEWGEGRVTELGPVSMASFGNSNHTPWNSEREFDEAVLREQIEALVDPYADGRPLLFNFHVPPYNSGLDTVQKLDGDLRPVVERGTPVEVPAGSTAVRAAIEKYQPAAGLHGHIHERKGVYRLGRTLCFNPGSDYASGVLSGLVLDLDDAGMYCGHVFTQG